jgi:antitoxin VapB
MAFSIRNPEANILARRLAELNNTSITEAVIYALKQSISNRKDKETPTQSAQRILKKHGLSFAKNRKPVPQQVFHDYDHDLIEDNTHVR